MEDPTVIQQETGQPQPSAEGEESDTIASKDYTLPPHHQEIFNDRLVPGIAFH